ncbi:MAG TPA: hypothetical protein VF590_19980 [Isosphaeraceae bacterium]
MDEWCGPPARRVVRTGATSVGAYAAMAREELQEFYCNDLEGVLRHLDGRARETERDIRPLGYASDRRPCCYD